MMYNEKRKKQYISVAISVNKELERVLTKRFNDVAEREKQWNQDLAEWTPNHILDYYKSLVNYSLESLMVLHSQFNGYARWCLANSLLPDSQNHYEEIDWTILNKECVNQVYLQKGITTRQELLKLIRDPKINNVYERFLLLGLFEGIGHEGYSDFQFLTMKDFEGNTLHLKDRTIEVSPELVELAKKSADTYEYIPYGDARRKWTFGQGDPRIIKRKIDGKLGQTDDKPAEELSFSGYRHIISLNMKRLSDLCNTPVFSSALLFESGRIEMIRKYMAEEASDAETVLSNHDKEITNQYAKIYNKGRYLEKWANFLK